MSSSTAADLDAAVAALRERAHGDRTVLVGVDGPSASGKSTFARALADLTGAPLVEVDEFWTWDDDPWWWDQLVDQVLVPLAAGQEARFRTRDWAAGGRATAGEAHLAPAPVVVVEGVTCTQRAVSHLYAYRVFVDAPEGVRLSRGVLRDGEQHRETWRRWIALEARHFTEDGTAARADLRVRGV